ncbi:hypothetical protein ACFC4C_23010 [Streptomyces sp. NPDC056039]|uniref:hypothetical protein n=1 Tax=Streptomyces sp. NPDC056039 TaxID=3345687 RepID=UPI0035E0AB43
MEWLIGAQEGGSSPWLNAMVGGAGAFLGASLTSLVALKTLSDTKTARRRTEEREATVVVSAACLQLRRDYPMWRPDHRDENGHDWPGHAWSVLGNAEPAVLVFRNSVLRQRLAESLMLIRDVNKIPPTLRRLLDDEPVYLACSDVLSCLGANLRGEPLPKASKDWKNAIEWVIDIDRSERARRWTSLLQNYWTPPGDEGQT